MNVELLRHAFPVPGRTASLAASTEQTGWDGLLVADSQHLVGDPYVELALAATTTTRLRLGTAVTNFVTRDPAVTASSILGLSTLVGPTMSGLVGSTRGRGWFSGSPPGA